jgi:hypothetical protein
MTGPCAVRRVRACVCVCRCGGVPHVCDGRGCGVIPATSFFWLLLLLLLQLLPPTSGSNRAT